MERYIGLDVHTQSCTMVVLSASGKRLSLDVLETNGEALISAIRSVRGKRHLCFEEGVQSAWLYELLEPHVDSIVVTVPKKRSGQKSDAIDATSLAEQLRTGAIETRVFKAPGLFSGLREAARAYAAVTHDLVRTKNRMKAVFRSRGISGTERELYHPEQRKPWLEKLPEHHRRLAAFHAEEMDALADMQKSAFAWMTEEARAHPIVARLATAPGLGPKRAPQLVAIVVTPHRFRTKRQFWSYCGLGIVQNSSADWSRSAGKWTRTRVTKVRGLNQNRNAGLKLIFKGAAMTIVSRRPDHPMHADYRRMLEKGIKPNLAKLTLARRIAAIVLAMWKHEEAYDEKRLPQRMTTIATNATPA